MYSIRVGAKELSIEVDEEQAIVYLSIEAVGPDLDDEPRYNQTIGIPVQDMGVLMSMLDRMVCEAQSREYIGLGDALALSSPAPAVEGQKLAGGGARRKTPGERLYR
jgi:hypothetical protein